jgi:hypothetical protein
MKRLLTYLFIVLGLGLSFIVNSNGKEINKEFYKFKKILIPLSKDGSWKLIGKKNQSIFDAQLTFKYLAQTKDGQLSKLIELVHVTEAAESPSQTFVWFNKFLYQTNGFNSCIPNNSALREKYYVYEESKKSSCFFTRNMDIEKEILYPTFKRETARVDTNHFPKIVKKYINNETKFPKIMLRSDHYFFTQKDLYAYFEMINPEVNGAPNTLFKSEKKSEYHPLNIDNHPQKKNFYLTWIKNQAKKHSKFESELKRKNKIDLAKYINYEPIKDLKDRTEIIQTVKKDKIESKTSMKLENPNQDKVLTNILYEKILENKYILKSKYIKKFDSELKYISRKIKADGYSSGADYTKRIKSMVLAVYINDADVNKIYKDPLINIDLGKLAYGWEASKLMYREVSYDEEKEKSSHWGSKNALIKSFGVKAIEDCRKISKKMRLNGGKCYFVDFRQFHGGHSKFNPPGTSNLLFSEKGKLLVENDTQIVDIKIINNFDNTNQKNEIVKNIDEDKKNEEKIIKSVSNEKKLKKIVKSSEVNFYKIKVGDYIDNPIVSIAKNNKIALPKGIWQVAKKSKISGWSPTDNVILINQSRADSSSFGEFIEIAVTKPSSKGYSRAVEELKKPCKKKYYFHDLQKMNGSGNSFSCFATGFVENDIFQIPVSNDNPWNFKFRDFFLKKGTLTDNILFSLSSYSSIFSTKSKLISVVYGSSLNSISDKNKIDFKNEELIKNIWTKKTIDFHNNFQNNMNFKESHMVNLDAEYQNLEKKYADLINVDKTKKTVKKEIKIKTEEKKVKVAKVKKQKKEEFKPKKTNKDNDAPVIEIAETITLSDSDYEFKGKVTDEAKTVYIEVDGYPIDVSEGIFTVKGYSPVDKQISIIAIDQYGNKSQPKLVNIKIDQKDKIIADLFEVLDPSNIKTKSNKDRVALIIGIEKYDQTPEASFANLDAKYFFDYSRKAFGVSKSNIKLLVDEDANLIKSLGTISKWLPGKIKDGETELIIFFAGHGLASNDGKELYLLPQDSDPDLLKRTALSRTELFKEIISLNPKNVTMFLDTCYSGVSRNEKTLLASARPVRIVAEEQEIPNNFTIFSASQLDQISSGLKEAKHGIFSYYLMKGLEGNADINKDKKITNGELLAYMNENVSQKASELGRKQNPSLAGDPNKVLMSYQ